MKHHSTGLAGVVFVLVLCVVLAGCSQGTLEPQSAAPIPVSVSEPVEREVTDYSDFTGRVTAVDSVEVRARVWGYLNKVNFKEGALVKKGDVLFEIDPRTYKTVLAQAEGNVLQLEARLKRLNADLDRALRLAEKGSISQKDLDQAIADRGETAGALKTQQGALAQAELDLSYTQVIAPISGRTSRYLVTEGNLIAAGQTGGTVLTTIVSVDPVYVYFDVDERTVQRVRQLIREGKAKSARDAKIWVKMGLATDEGFPHKGTIDFVDNQVNPRTGTLRLRGVFRNKDPAELLRSPAAIITAGGPGTSIQAGSYTLLASVSGGAPVAAMAGQDSPVAEVLSPGYFARVRVPIGFPHKALLISDRAIDTDQAQKIVYVVNKENKVVTRPIRLGARQNGLRVIEEGLTRDDLVVVTGLQHIRPGVLVEPQRVEMPGKGTGD